jgi:antibiotic biosynthesis monooxygenase (ABM) superfamily enzyme
MRFLKLAIATMCLASMSFIASAADMPKSIIHLIVFKLKPGVAEADINAKLKPATEKLTKDFPGITRVWFTPTKVQHPEDGFKHAFVMEFKDKAALDAYEKSPARQDFLKVFYAIRDGGTSVFDVTN